MSKLYFFNFELTYDESNDELHKAALRGFISEFYRCYSHRFSKWASPCFELKRSYKEYYDEMQHLIDYLIEKGFNVNENKSFLDNYDKLNICSHIRNNNANIININTGFYFRIGVYLDDINEDEKRNIIECSKVKIIYNEVKKYIMNLFDEEMKIYGVLDIKVKSIVEYPPKKNIFY